MAKDRVWSDALQGYVEVVYKKESDILKEEIEKLRIWKEEATILLMLWDDVFELLPPEYQILGKNKSECVRRYIEKVQASC